MRAVYGKRRAHPAGRAVLLLRPRHKMATEFVIGSVQPAEEIEVMPAKPGRSAGFETLFREHYPKVVAMLARLTGDRAQAEEIASDVFCKVSQGGPTELPWIYRVATNAGLDAIRSNLRRRQREDAAGVESLTGRETRNALDEILRRERRAQVQKILSELKPRDAQLLLRAEGLAYRE